MCLINNYCQDTQIARVGMKWGPGKNQLHVYLLEQATIYMNCGLFGEALLHLQTVTRHEKRDWNRVLPIINQAKCHLATTNENEAIIASVELVSLLEQSDIIDKLQSISEICDNEIEELITKFLNIRSTNTAILLSRCRIKLKKSTLATIQSCRNSD